MRALRYFKYGGISELSVVECAAPLRARDEVRVGVVCAALNPKDALVRKGRFRFLSGRQFPKTVGLDFAGQVLESADPALPKGARVFGALIEPVVVHSWHGGR